jgi:nitroreductase
MKPADVRYPVHELIRNRWSPRAFAKRMVERDVLRSLFEAARWAPSCFNEQPWRYLLATQDDPEEFSRMLSCLVPRNQAWAAGAPVLGISFAKKTFSRNGKPNRTAQHDVGLASESLTLEAMARSVYVHQMAGIDLEKIRATYDVPPDFDPVAALAIGYLGEAHQLPEDFRDAEREPRKRNELGEFVFGKLWQTPADTIKDVAQD